MLPQFREKHKFSYENFDAGLRLMIWGFFMKLCVADRVSTYVDAVYNNYMEHSGVSLLLATFFFTFQIYCDFAGYSLIAIGSSKMMGFTLMENFHRPYLRKVSRNFGGVGTFRCRHGSKIIYIFRWEGIEWGITDICGICL